VIPCRQVTRRMTRGFSHHAQAVAAQVEFESQVSKRLITFQHQALRSRRFQHGFHRFNLHRRTKQRRNTLDCSALQIV